MIGMLFFLGVGVKMGQKWRAHHMDAANRKRAACGWGGVQKGEEHGNSGLGLLRLDMLWRRKT
jgi:hypothetical protein